MLVKSLMRVQGDEALILGSELSLVGLSSHHPVADDL